MATSTFDKKIILSKEATEKFLEDLIETNKNNSSPNIDIAKMLMENKEETKKWLSDWEK